MNINNTNTKSKSYLSDTIIVETNTIACDGGIDFGHPLVYLNLDKKGEIVCPYCSKKYIFKKNKAI